MRTRGRRKFREYERRWNGRWVDKNLENEWLIRLNQLNTLKLTSICEGHFNSPRNSVRNFPHIILRVKEPWLSPFVYRWHELKAEIFQKIETIFDHSLANIFLELEVRFSYRITPRRSSDEENVVIRITRITPRVSTEMDKETFAWFEEIIKKIENFDQFIHDLKRR